MTMCELTKLVTLVYAHNLDSIWVNPRPEVDYLIQIEIRIRVFISTRVSLTRIQPKLKALCKHGYKYNNYYFHNVIIITFIM